MRIFYKIHIFYMCALAAIKELLYDDRCNLALGYYSNSAQCLQFLGR